MGIVGRHSVASFGCVSGLRIVDVSMFLFSGWGYSVTCFPHVETVIENIQQLHKLELSGCIGDFCRACRYVTLCLCCVCGGCRRFHVAGVIPEEAAASWFAEAAFRLSLG